MSATTFTVIDKQTLVAKRSGTIDSEHLSTLVYNEATEDLIIGIRARVGSDIIVSVDGVYEIQSAPPKTPSVAEIKAALVVAVQFFIDETAVSLGYDSVYTACTYADEPSVPKFQKEGKALRKWRSLVWATCWQVMADVQAGNRAIPTPEQLIAELPAFSIPE